MKSNLHQILKNEESQPFPEPRKSSVLFREWGESKQGLCTQLSSGFECKGDLPEILDHCRVQALRQPEVSAAACHDTRVKAPKEERTKQKCMQHGNLTAMHEVLYRGSLKVHIYTEWHHHHLPARPAPHSLRIDFRCSRRKKGLVK
jgi:hypothetical protein